MRPFLAVVAGLWMSIAGVPAHETARILVHVSVEDALGKPVVGLSATAFSLSIDGVTHPIESVIRADAPLTILLLVDDSLSMMPYTNGVELAARLFVADLDAADRWRVGMFADRILFSRAFAPGRSSFRFEPRDPITLRERIVQGGSPLWDAIHQSVELLAQEGGRRTLLVFSDGRAGGNWFGLEEVANFSVDHQVSLVAVAPLPPRGIRQDPETVLMVRPAANLDRLTRYTGGLLVGGYDAKEQPLKQLRGLAGRLRAGYALTFHVPQPDGRRHRLDVRVTTPGVEVRAPMAFRAVRD